MAIKLGLETAYDRVSWDFISVLMTAIGIPESLQKVIMSTISFASMLDIDIGRWKPIQLSRTGPTISHLFFADGLVIFCKAQVVQARLLKNILNRFCEVLEHRVSTRKSNIYFSNGINNEVRNQIVQLFGFQEVQNLGNYLGVPLLHNRVTKSTFSFVIDNIRRKLNNWDARKLSIAGRITLAQSVLLSIPNYFMQSMLIPKGVCAKVERLVRQFVWGCDNGHPKMLLRSLTKIWPSLRENLAWAIRDGVSIRCSKDSWILSMGPLISKIPSYTNLDLDCFVKELVNADRSWNLIMGFGRYLGVCLPFKAEVWSILDGFLLLLNKRFKRVIIQTDSLEVVQALIDLGMESSSIIVFRRTQRTMKSKRQWRILHIPREHNLVANRLAKLSLN
ncbi:hypothetical protein J1N35_042476 [Gossypium stocksii]|uniref:RNase H type-1 domain-containing protein n=1 Tax=Gossypium stocksii TaxID=47602 RepID=A0A9D3UJD9_9ROSI|nr:hypothetical protein J1N35_042476 [Gossypium stocksii]